MGHENSFDVATKKFYCTTAIGYYTLLSFSSTCKPEVALMNTKDILRALSFRKKADKTQGKGAHAPLFLLALEPRIMFDGAGAVTAEKPFRESQEPRDWAQPTPFTDTEVQATSPDITELLGDYQPPESKELLFVESNVADYPSLLGDMAPGVEVHLLNSHRDGLQQMAEVLAGRHGIEALHIVSHGSKASLNLGSLALTAQNIPEHADNLGIVGGALSQNADILLYGCDVGAGSGGEALLAALAQATQADIAASDDPTGSATLDADWVLEKNNGSIEAEQALSGEAKERYRHTLASTDGALDETFGVGGKVTTIIGSDDDRATAVAIQTDGKILAGGYAKIGSGTDFALARYNQDGTLDSTFGEAGKLTTHIGTSDSSVDRPYAIALQEDGKILLGGYSAKGSHSNFALVRYDQNGTLDPTFNDDGKLTTPISSGSTGRDYFALAIQADGKIVAGGSSLKDGKYDFTLMRYNSDGSPDSTFDDDGHVTTSIGTEEDKLTSLAIQTDGKISKIIAGGYSAIDSINHDFALARYNNDGSLDRSFDHDGKQTTSIGPKDIATSLALQEDGRILLGGYSNLNDVNDFALARYNNDGSLDSSFSDDGMTTTDIGTATDIAYALAVQVDGKILAGGYAYRGTNDFAVVRYNTDGSLDEQNFDGNEQGNGKITTLVRDASDVANAIALQADGKIVLGGASVKADNSDFALTRYFGVTIPTVSSVTSSAEDGSYTVGETIPITVNFREPVHLNTDDGTPTLTLDIGAAQPAVATYTSHNSTSLTFDYPVQAGDTSAKLGVLSADALTLNGATLKGTEDPVDAVLTLPLPGEPDSLSGSRSIAVDTTAPTILAVTLPALAMKIDDLVTATITVENDGDETYTLSSSSIAGFPLDNLTKIDNSTYTAQFTVTSGGADVAASQAIPVSVALFDETGNANTPYTTAIEQEGDPIDTTPPFATLSPENGTTEVDVGSDLTLAFNEVVHADAGITIKSVIDDLPVENVFVTGTGTSTLTLNPEGKLLGGTEYYVLVEADAIKDTVGNTFEGISSPNGWRFSTRTDTDGLVLAGSERPEPASLPTTARDAEGAVALLDFTIRDTGLDTAALAVSQIVFHTSGTGDFANLDWQLSGEDAQAATGIYDAEAHSLTFPDLTLSIADGTDETYTVRAHFKGHADHTLAEGQTFGLRTDGDSDFTLAEPSSKMLPTEPVDNGSGSVVDVTATRLAYVTEPMGSLSGVALATQPVVKAVDDLGVLDMDFSDTITLVEASPGNLTHHSATALAGVAAFSNLTYVATEDQEAFVLTAESGALLPVKAPLLTSDVQATQLIFGVEPEPLAVVSGVTLDFLKDPALYAVDDHNVLDTDYVSAITLSEVGGAGSATLTLPLDRDTQVNTVTQTASGGVATFTDLAMTYTPLGGSETFALEGRSSDLATVRSQPFSVRTPPQNTVSTAQFPVENSTTTLTDLRVSSPDGVEALTVAFSTSGAEPMAFRDLSAGHVTQTDPDGTDGTITLHGSVAAINAVLAAGLQVGAESENFTLTMQTHEDHDRVPLSSTDTVDFTVNHPPVNTISLAQSLIAQSRLTLQELRVHDRDVGDQLTLVLSTSRKEPLAFLNVGHTVIPLDLAGQDGSLSIRGSEAAINAVLADGVQIKVKGGHFNLMMTSHDDGSGLLIDSDQIAFTVRPLLPPANPSKRVNMTDSHNFFSVKTQSSEFHLERSLAPPPPPALRSFVPDLLSASAIDFSNRTEPLFSSFQKVVLPPLDTSALSTPEGQELSETTAEEESPPLAGQPLTRTESTKSATLRKMGEPDAPLVSAPTETSTSTPGPVDATSTLSRKTDAPVPQRQAQKPEAKMPLVSVSTDGLEPSTDRAGVAASAEMDRRAAPALSVNKGIADVDFFKGKRIQYRVPMDAFSFAGQAKSIALQAKLADGNGLPDWLYFNQKRGIFEGVIPLDTKATDLNITVTAKDKQGHNADVTFKLSVNEPEPEPSAIEKKRIGDGAAIKTDKLIKVARQQADEVGDAVHEKQPQKGSTSEKNGRFSPSLVNAQALPLAKLALTAQLHAAGQEQWDAGLTELFKATLLRGYRAGNPVA